MYSKLLTSIAWILLIQPASSTFRIETGICLREQAVLHHQNTHNKGETLKIPDNGRFNSKGSWRKIPHCVRGYCIYVNPSLEGGTVLIADSKNAELMAGFPPLEARTGAKLFRKQAIPGKGVGLVATRPIRRGETIMVQNPYLIVQDPVHQQLEREQRQALYKTALQYLPQDQRAVFLQQEGESLASKISANSFPMMLGEESPDAYHYGSFADGFLLNHDCRPNAQYHITNLTLTTIAARSIAPDEEITIAYIPLLATRADRQAQLRTWGFECHCSQCAQTKVATMASDARVRRINLITAVLDSGDPRINPNMGAELVKLHMEERLDVCLGHAYTRAALNYALFGKAHAATVFARWAIDALTRDLGPEAGDIPAMKVLAENPMMHWAWGKRLKKHETASRNDKEL